MADKFIEGPSTIFIKMLEVEIGSGMIKLIRYFPNPIHEDMLFNMNEIIKK